MSIRFDFSMLSRSGSIVLLTLTCLRGQQSPPAEGARQLYYLATSPKDSLPPVAPASPSQTASPAKIEAPHLGLRYNIVLVDQAGHRQPVSADRVLHTGNCFGIDLHSNRSGYVYVFAKQSSGSWVPLLPSAEMPDETNVLDPSVALKIPKHHCFGVENPPGEETLFVVLSRNPRDFYELYEGYKTRSSVTSGPANHATGQHLQLAKSKQLSAAVQHLDERFGTRDISITKANTSRDSNEPAGSVYVVNTSARPTSSIVTKIVIRHR